MTTTTDTDKPTEIRQRFLIDPRKDGEAVPFAEMGELWYEERSTGMRVVGVKAVFLAGNEEATISTAARSFSGLIRAVALEEQRRTGRLDSLVGDDYENVDDDDDEESPGDDDDDPGGFGKFRRPRML